jgi:hypothetical protein
MHGHQRKRRKESLEEACNALLSIEGDLHDAKTFEDLIILIEKRIGRIYDIAELYIYDTATRIGAYLELWPQHVYLHSGTKKGARLLGLDTSRRYLRVRDMPREMETLEPYEMEDVLCMFVKTVKQPPVGGNSDFNC